MANRLGPSEKTLKRRLAPKQQFSTPPPPGLPPGLLGTIEHMRGHALYYYVEAGLGSPQGDFLWKQADVLERMEWMERMGRSADHHKDRTTQETERVEQDV